MAAVEALKALRTNGGSVEALRIANAIHTGESRVPRQTELLISWVVQCWTDGRSQEDPHPIVDPGYHTLFRSLIMGQATVLSPAVCVNLLTKWTDRTRLSEECLRLVAAGLAADLERASAADTWIESFVEIPTWLAHHGRPSEGMASVFHLVLQRIDALVEDVVIARKLVASTAMRLADVGGALRRDGTILDDWSRTLFSLPVLRIPDVLDTLVKESPSMSGHVTALYVGAVDREAVWLFAQPSSSREDTTRFLRTRVRDYLSAPVTLVVEQLLAKDSADSWDGQKLVWRSLAKHVGALPDGHAMHELLLRVAQKASRQSYPQVWSCVSALVSVSVAAYRHVQKSALVEAVCLGVPEAAGLMRTWVQYETLRGSLESAVDVYVAELARLHSCQEAIEILAAAVKAADISARLGARLEVLCERNGYGEVSVLSRLLALGQTPVEISVSREAIARMRTSAPGRVALTEILRYCVMLHTALPHVTGLDELVKGSDRDLASAAIRYSVTCLGEITVEPTMAQLRKGQCWTAVDDSFYVVWEQRAPQAVDDLCAAMLANKRFPQSVVFWELPKLSAAYISAVAASDCVHEVVNVLAHIGARHPLAARMGSKLLKAAIDDAEWSGYLYLLQKVRTAPSDSDVSAASIAEAIVIGHLPLKIGIDVLTKGDEAFEKYLSDASRGELNARQVDAIATMLAEFGVSDKTREVTDRLLKAASKLSPSAEACEAAVRCAQVDPGAWHVARDLASRYLRVGSGRIGVETSSALVQAVRGDAYATYSLLKRSSDPGAVVEALDWNIYTALWLLPDEDVLVSLLTCQRPGSGKIVAAHLGSIVTLANWECLKALCVHRAAVLRSHHFAAICGLAARGVANQAETVISVLSELVSQRSDLIPNAYTSFTSALAASIASLRHSPQLAETVVRLLSMAAKGRHRGLVNHAPRVLLSYVRSACDEDTPLSPATRHTLEPGLHAICEVIARGGDQGRQGEGSGLAVGIAEGAEVENEMWARLWLSYRRKRYVGQG